MTNANEPFRAKIIFYTGMMDIEMNEEKLRLIYDDTDRTVYIRNMSHDQGGSKFVSGEDFQKEFPALMDMLVHFLFYGEHCNMNDIDWEVFMQIISVFDNTLLRWANTVDGKDENLISFQQTAFGENSQTVVNDAWIEKMRDLRDRYNINDADMQAIMNVPKGFPQKITQLLGARKRPVYRQKIRPFARLQHEEKKRRFAIIKEREQSGEHGWKTKLANEWNVSTTALNKFTKKMEAEE